MSPRPGAGEGGSGATVAGEGVRTKAGSAGAGLRGEAGGASLEAEGRGAQRRDLGLTWCQAACVTVSRLPTSPCDFTGAREEQEAPDFLWGPSEVPSPISPHASAQGRVLCGRREWRGWWGARALSPDDPRAEQGWGRRGMTQTKHQSWC